jgi:hypothetical protein
MTPIHTVVQFHQDTVPYGHGQLYPYFIKTRMEADEPKLKGEETQERGSMVLKRCLIMT